MSDLEDLWDELPAGEAPVGAVLAAARADAARRRKLRQTVIAVGATAAVVGAFVAGAAVGNRPGPNISASVSDARPVAFQADLEPAHSCDDLLESYRDRALEIVTAWGWQPSVPMYGKATLDSAERLSDLSAAPQVSASKGQRSQTSSETGTNVQETGVDEPDTVKTDGRLVVRLRGRELIVHDASGTTMTKRATLHLPRLVDGEILMSGSTIVAIGADSRSPRDDMTGARRGTRLITISLAKPSEPKIESTVTYSSRVISARQHGPTVRLVLASGLPTLDFVRPEGKVTDREALAANRRAVEKSTIKDWLPTYDTRQGDKRLLACTDVAVPPESAGLDTVSIVGFTAKAPSKPHAIGLAGATTIAYESKDHLYLADGQLPWDCRMCRLEDMVIPGTRASTGGGTTHLYDFELDGVDAIHVASGEVEGTIADRWSLDEARDVLRVAVGPSSETGNFNSVVTFRREGEELAEIGRLDGLGRNEELKGVRWFDDLAVLVTFRQVDPLYTVDLADPAKPRLIGKLKIPGFSDYLHPLSDAWMLGVGQDGRSGAQIALFDTADLAHVRRTAVETYPRAEAIAGWEPRAFTWLPKQDTALTVIQQGRRVDVVALKVTHGRLSSTRTSVEYGDDARQVRTLGMPDGRIVLVTGEDVRFFEVP